MKRDDRRLGNQGRSTGSARTQESTDFDRGTRASERRAPYASAAHHGRLLSSFVCFFYSLSTGPTVVLLGPSGRAHNPGDRPSASVARPGHALHATVPSKTPTSPVFCLRAYANPVQMSHRDILAFFRQRHPSTNLKLLLGLTQDATCHWPLASPISPLFLVP